MRSLTVQNSFFKMKKIELNKSYSSWTYNFFFLIRTFCVLFFFFLEHFVSHFFFFFRTFVSYIYINIYFRTNYVLFILTNFLAS